MEHLGGRGRGRGYSWRGRKTDVGSGALPKRDGSSSSSWREPTASFSMLKSEGRRGGHQPSQHAPKYRTYEEPNQRKFVLDLQNLLKLTNETTEPSEIIRSLEDDLASHLKKNSSNADYLELLLIALGVFCKKNGTSQFTDSFVNVVKILAAQQFFSQITFIVISIPKSRATNFPPKEERLKSLITSISYLSTEMLVKMPAFACNYLGENFFIDIISLKDMPSIKSLNNDDVFNVLDNGSRKLKVNLVKTF